MKRYKIITHSDAFTIYEIEAKNKKEAEEKYENGEWIDETAEDFQNEEITEIEELN